MSVGVPLPTAAAVTHTATVDIEGTSEEGTSDAVIVIVARPKCFFCGNSKHARQRCPAKDSVQAMLQKRTFCQSLQAQPGYSTWKRRNYWRHYLTGRHFIIKTDQRSVAYMLDSKQRGSCNGERNYLAIALLQARI